MDKQVVMLRPAPGTVIENLVLDGGGGTQQYGIYINCNAAPSKDPSYVCTGLTIRNCRITGFKQNIVILGAQRGTQIYGNVSANSTGTADDMLKGGHSHGMYTEGLQQQCSIHDNLFSNNGWWKDYDPTQLNQRVAANMNHGWYGNETAGMDDTTLFYNNTFIDNVGSDVGCRLGLKAWNNVFRGVGDQSLIVGQFGKSAAIVENAFFGPRADAVPYYGGGIHLLCPGIITGNLYAGNAKITNNPTALDMHNIVVPGTGYWPKAGAVVATKPLPMIEDYCLATYGKHDVSMLQPSDAPHIVEWLQLHLMSGSF